MQLNLRMAVTGGNDEVPPRKQPGTALGVVLHPAGFVAQREPAAIGELNLEDHSVRD
jgi:hypothetical protein